MFEWDTDRQRVYDRLRASIGHTPLLEIQGIELPGRCRLFAKPEYLNPTGSHYDREMLNFLEALEKERTIRPGETQMLETTTGNSGASFAWLCRALGYPPPIIVTPADMPLARRAQMSAYDAIVVLSEAGKYITGISRKYAEELIRERPKPLYAPQHWTDEHHGVAAMRDCGIEILNQADELGVTFSAFILALGNGSSARGIGDVLRPVGTPDKQGVKLVGMEPFESPIVAEFLELGSHDRDPDSVYTPVGLDRRKQGNRSHGIIGTGPHRPNELYPNVKYAAKRLSLIKHIRTEEAEEMQKLLMDKCALSVGMSSAACVVAAIQYAEGQGLRNRCLGTVFYDPAWKYLDEEPSKPQLVDLD